MVSRCGQSGATPLRHGRSLRKGGVRYLQEVGRYTFLITPPLAHVQLTLPELFTAVSVIVSPSIWAFALLLNWIEITAPLTDIEVTYEPE